MKIDNIVIATHGKFGEELLKSAEMIVGKIHNAYSLSLLPEMSFEDFMNEANKLLERLEGETFVFVDLFGGSPSNVMTVLIKKYQCHVFTGLNLPIFIDFYLKINSIENKDIQEVIEDLQNTGINSFIYTNDKII